MKQLGKPRDNRHHQIRQCHTRWDLRDRDMQIYWYFNHSWETDVKALESSTIRNFAPSWFAAVMGTGILAMTGLQHANALPILGPVSIVLTYFNIALFFILLVPWSLRWIFFRKEALSDFRHPIQSNFYPTMTISIVLMSAHFGVLGHPLWAYYTWWIGALGTVIFSVLIPLEMFKSEEIAIDHISPAWFMPQSHWLSSHWSEGISFPRPQASSKNSSFS